MVIEISIQADVVILQCVVYLFQIEKNEPENNS